MKDRFVIAKTLKLPWIDQFIYLPGGIICCTLYPVISLVSGQDHLLGWPLSTWLLIGIGLLILAVIEHLALIFGELHDGRLRIYLRGSWRGARLRVLDADPDTYLRRMNRVHAAFVRSESSTPGVVEIRPE